VINGPFGPYRHGPILFVIEMITHYVEKCIYKAQTEDLKSFMPKQEAVNDFKIIGNYFSKELPGVLGAGSKAAKLTVDVARE